MVSVMPVRITPEKSKNQIVKNYLLPGAIALARTPECLNPCAAAYFVKCASPPFTVPYAVSKSGNVVVPEAEEVFTIAPFVFERKGIAAENHNFFEKRIFFTLSEKNRRFQIDGNKLVE